MELFKGFVPTKNKKCVMAFKGKTSSELLNKKEVENLPEYAGILSDDVVLIDIDDEKQSDILLKIVEDNELLCRVYATTRGKHFLFKNAINDDYIIQSCRTHTKLACGIEADIKVGCRSSYSILKYEGVEREIIYDILDGEEYQEVPKWLTPINRRIDFSKMSKGSGRNQKLFNYILTLQSEDFSNEEARECIRIINQYVLKEPLDESELETILRDDAFQKPVFFKKNVFLFDKFATYLKNNNHIVKINGQLHIYKDGIYVDGTRAIESEMIRHIPNLSRSKRTEVLTYLDILVNENTKSSDARYIAFRNGVYDVVNDTMEDFSPDKIILNKIDYDYNPNAYSEIVDKTLDKMSCGREDVRGLLEEVAGYPLYRRNELRKAFIFIGDKANGKSTYLDMIVTMLGEHNTTSLDLKELGERFKTAELFGKLACIGDDIGDEFIPNPAVFKKLVSGDRMNVERKGQQPFDFNNYSKLLFSANNIPRIKDKSGAVINRLVIIPFNARFSPDDDDYDPYIKYKLREQSAIEYLIKLGVDGLKRVLKNHKFTICEDVQKEIDAYEERNNPILLFFKEDVKIENESTKDVFAKYQVFCAENNFTPMSRVEFSKQVKKHLGVECVQRRVGNERFQIFIKKEGTYD